MKTTEQKLNEMFEAFKKEVLKEFSEENEYKTNAWYKSDDTDYLIYVIEHDGINITNGYGFSDNGTWMGFVTIKDRCGFAVTHLATDKEVEEALIAEAKRRGFKEGVEVKSLTRDKLMLRFETLCFFDNGLVDKWGSFIFKNGKWAEIVEDKIMIGGHEIVLNNDRRIKVGCKIFLKSEIRDIKDIMINNKFKTVAFDGIETDLETIEKILKL